MRAIPGVVLLLVVACPAIATGQSVLLHGSAGPTALDSSQNLSYGYNPGRSFAAGVGLGLTPRLTLLIEVERTQRPSQLRTDERGGVFGFRGGTLTLAGAQLRASLFRPDRIGPYGLLGLAAGVSRPNVTDAFPDRVTHGVRALVFGGGIHVPLGDRVSLFGDGRMIFGTEGQELLAVAPIRAGVAWRF